MARNWRCREGELDLIVRHGRVFVFCEVKTRTSDAFGYPVEAVTRRSRRGCAGWRPGGWQDAPPAPREIRFDVASVLAGEIEVLEGAF